MLVVTRTRNERIQIGDDITIEVIDVMSGGKVRLGIQAPINIRIHRLDEDVDREKTPPKERVRFGTS